MQGLQKRIRKILLSNNYADAEYASSYTDGYKKAFPKEICDHYGPFEFEGHIVQGIKNYDPYLKVMYGDYMKIPPEEKRIQHNFYHIDLDHPYREYKGNDRENYKNRKR